MMRAHVLLLLSAMSLVLTGCGAASDQALEVSVIGEPDSIFQTERLPLSEAAGLVRGSTVQGLVARDAAGELVPALAARWIVSDDGQSFIFRLADARWNNGGKVTAGQVATGLRARIKRARQGRLQGDLSAIRDVRAMTGEVIEIRLTSPKPALLQILAQPELGVSHRGYGTGPLVKTRSGRHLDFTRKPEGEEEITGTKKAGTPAIRLRAERAARAIVRYRGGDAVVVLNGRYTALPLIDAAGIDRSELRLDPVSGLFGLVFAENTGFVGDAARREAVSMAIDRDRLRTALDLPAGNLSNRLIPIGTEGYDGVTPEPWADMTMEARRATAKARVLAWEAVHGLVPPLRIALPAGPGSGLLFASIRADLAGAGLTARRVDMRTSADLRLIDEVASYSRASWYLGRLSCAQRRVCDADGDALLKRARAMTDLDERARLLGEAERSMTGYASFIPLGPPVRWSLVRGEPAGFAPNPFGDHPLWPMAQIPT